MPHRLALGAAALAALVAALPGGPIQAAPSPPDSAARSVTVQAPWFGPATPPLEPGQIELAVVSSLPATVTGEDARVEVRGLQPGDQVHLDRNGSDVSSALAPVRDGVVGGVVTGLRV